MSKVKNYLNESPDSLGVKDFEDLIPLWIFGGNHKRAAVMYLIIMAEVLLLGTGFEIFSRLGFLTGYEGFLSHTFGDSYNWHIGFFSLLFILPAIPFVFGNFLLPPMLGAKNLKYPFLTFLGFHSFMAGGTFLTLNLIFSKGDLLWLSSAGFLTDSVILSLSAFLIGQSLLFNGLNFILTIHFGRSEEVSLFKIPLFAWSLYASSMLQILASGILIFPFALGAIDSFSDSGLLTNNLQIALNWLYSPEAFGLALLPAIGLLSELLPVYSRRSMFAYNWMVASFFLAVFIKNCQWFTSLASLGNPSTNIFVNGFFSLMMVIPAVIWLLNTLGTLFRGKKRFNLPEPWPTVFLVLMAISALISLIFKMVFLTIGLSLIILIPLFLWFVLNLNAPELTKSEKQTIPAPFLWCIASFFTLFVGGLSQILLALPLTGSYLKGSYYEMASEHYLWIGVLMAFLTGLYFWWSKFFGKTMDEEKSISRCIKVFFSVHVMGLSASLLGFAGQPVATSNYPGALALLQIVLTLSVIVLAFNIFGIVFDFIGSLKKKEEADINPYESLSFEWSLPSPPQLESDPKTGNGDPYGY